MKTYIKVRRKVGPIITEPSTRTGKKPLISLLSERRGQGLRRGRFFKAGKLAPMGACRIGSSFDKEREAKFWRVWEKR